jgi:FMN phosphatase YigB (HAD superfamily)
VEQWINPSAYFISDQVGISKPNPQLYQRACSALGLDPHEAMYIGDSPVHDIDPVNSLGMISVRIHRDNRFEGVQGKTAPRYEIRSFEDLVPILAEDFGIQLPA